MLAVTRMYFEQKSIQFFPLSHFVNEYVTQIQF